ncbi:hypothetical protein G6F31_020771 [Rhizopus arrhizus]|nr:hypothetical protein G6F31_020771 [Rhizopus arrhizus]
MIRMIPSQKLGIDMPDSAAMLAPISMGLPLRTAAMIPIGMPISSAKNIAIAASCRGLAQVALQHVSGPDGELRRPTGVQAQLFAQRGKAGRVRRVAQHQRGRIARDQAHQDEHGKRNDQ